ncbi:Drug/Metabolite Transporter (DMT) Superfamily [Thraustotheca clavata]|uniref:Drug/Metabolite Transporter (DMT) Superfamily n=1 Tax=Thraustotheca clavata TaxID=74557 RepID=A0A1V9ZRA8_9STRA|nr:Drug/Metabolite Transporter (DMT) Superfamily [Thraustotheca clavata]
MLMKEVSKSGVALLLGTASALSLKITYGLENGFIPLLQTGLVFLAMALLLPVYYLTNVWHSNQVVVTLDRKKLVQLCRPAAIDVLATALGMGGLMYLAPSIHKLLQYGVMPIVAIIRSLAMKDVFMPVSWSSVILYTIAIGIIALSVIYRDNATSAMATEGLLLLAGSCLVQSVLFIVDADPVGTLPPLVGIGVQGLWGCIILILFVYPIAYFTSFENIFDSVASIYSSWGLILSTLTTVLTTTAFHISAINVLYDLDDVYSFILATGLAPSVWIVGLILEYTTALPLGAAWAGWSSVCQLFGMGLLLYATTLVHDEAPELPCGDSHRVFAYSASGVVPEPCLSNRVVDYGAFKAADYKSRRSFVI